MIVPGLTESYGSKHDPEEEDDIPFCTLKMFPEEAVHCVEWARDRFGKFFEQQPAALQATEPKPRPPRRFVRPLPHCRRRVGRLQLSHG